MTRKKTEEKHTPWIQYAYLEELPHFDSAIYIIREISDNNVKLEFHSPYLLHIFLYQVMLMWISHGRAWNSLVVTRRNEKYFVSLQVYSNPEFNQMKVKL